MNQVPCAMAPYVVQQAFVPAPQAQPQPKLNAVNIEINNPTVGNQGAAQQPQYAPVTMPTYAYPQAPVYNYPQAQTQPVYYPQQMPQPALPVAPQAAPEPAPAPVAPQPQQVQVVPAQVNNNAPVQPVAPQITEAPAAPAVPSPVVTEAPKAPEQKPEVVQPEAVTPQVDVNAFASRLTGNNYDDQEAAMKEITNTIKNSPEKADSLLDSKIVDALSNLIDVDTTSLEDVTPEQVAAREKMLAGKEVTDQEKELANTLSPKEKAERNKSYALFTLATIQKCYGEEIAKLSDKPVPLTELPGAAKVVDTLKDNPDPLVRASAIQALSYIQRPEYKKDLTTVFTVATNDADKGVADTAKAALEELNKI